MSITTDKTQQKILIVDSHPVYIFKTEGFLKGLTFNNVTLARTGKEALEIAKTQKPDIVILSAMLSDMNSAELCQSMKMTLRAVKLIVQIGLFAEEKDVENLRQAGADHIVDRLEKNFSPLQSALES